MKAPSKSYGLAVAAIVACLVVLRPCAAQPSPFPVEVRQPNGLQLRLQLKGSGTYHWYEDEAGYAIVEVPRTYFYAGRDASGGLTPLPLKVGEADPAKAGLVPAIEPSQAFLAAFEKRSPENASSSAADQAPNQPPTPIEISKADGGRVTLTPKSRGGYQWLQDDRGYSAVAEPARYELAVRGPSSELLPSGLLAGEVPAAEAGITPRLSPGVEFLRNRMKSDTSD
jgi:hypothetical protein